MMKRIVIVGTALVLSAMLFFSCNKNRFDFNEMESVEGSGQWKLPIGRAHVTLGDLMTQMGDNDLVSYDDEGNLQIVYQFSVNNVIKGSDFLNLGTLNFSTSSSFENPFPGMSIAPIDTVYRFSQKIQLSADSAGIESAIVKSGEMMLTFQNTNLGHISKIDFSSSGIIEPNGDSLVRQFESVTGNTIDLSGATFYLHDPVTGVADSTLTLNYAVHYQLAGIDAPEYIIETIIALNHLKLQHISGYIDELSYEFEYDTIFSLPLNNIEGQAKLVGADISINERNTFGNLYAALQIDQAELYGGGAEPYAIFGSDPYVIQVIPSEEFVNVLPEQNIDLMVDTRYDAFRTSAVLNFNPSHADRLVTIDESSALDMMVDAVIPMRFNIPGVYYIDTLELSMPDVSSPELLEEIRLTILFDSGIPFNLEGQLYAFNSRTGQLSELMSNTMHVNGSFDGTPVRTEAVVDVTRDRMVHLFEADKLVMRFGVDTDGRDVLLNLDDGLDMTIKADIIYGGTVDVND